MPNYRYELTDVEKELPDTVRPVVMVHDAPARWVSYIGICAFMGIFGGGRCWMDVEGRLPSYPIRFWMDVPEPLVKPNADGSSLYERKLI
jgi:hypothetical protein